MRNRIRFFSSLSVLLLSAGAGVFYLSSLSTDKVQVGQSNDLPSSEKVSMPSSIKEDIAKKASVSQTPDVTDNRSFIHEHDHHSPSSANPAADLKRLPIPMQQEIKELTARDEQNRTYQTIEVEPGIVAVIANNGPKVVPVAVMNEDGTVSIHEY